MLWEIESDLLVAQGCIERALDLIVEGRKNSYNRSETSASKEYQFTHAEVGSIGKVKISILPHNRTELYGYTPDPPDNKWLVAYLPRHIPWGNFSKPMQSLLLTYSWQIEKKVFDLSGKELFNLAHSKDEVDFGWDKYGLDDAELRKQALNDLGDWKKKVHERRTSEFEEILSVIESTIKGAGLEITKPNRTGKATLKSSPQSLEAWDQIPAISDDREIIRLWCKGHTNAEIAVRVSQEKDSITNRISYLRRKYPEAKIPTDKERRKLMIKR